MNNCTPQERVSFLSWQLEQAKKEHYESSNTASEAGKRINMLKAWLDIERKGVCPACDGHGKGWVHYAQDDTKLERCEQCKGTGLPTKELG